MSGILIAGTSSDAGKSLIVTGLCRAARRRGIDVVPFKAQNMSNNSMVCADGAEIGRAQYLQAAAAGVEPSSALNPVLLKPGTDRRSFIVLRGRPSGTLEAGQYATGRAALAKAAWAAYSELAAGHELVICEGAGSPAEINLRVGDYTNMGLARRFNLPVVVVGDIDRGGVLASIYGTWALLDDADRELLEGYLINKFRGDAGILAPGLDEISRRTGLRNFGVLPFLADVWLDGEDSLTVGRWRPNSTSEDLRVAVVRLPRVSNSTDIDALAFEPDVSVEVTTDPKICERADLLVLPGSRATVDDLAWLRERGIAEVISKRARQNQPILGICGGYQMLAERIDDEHESRAGAVAGLGLLPVHVEFGADKVTSLTAGSWRNVPAGGYEIHHGIMSWTAEPDEVFLDGGRVGQIWGTMWHGAFERDEFRRVFLSEIAAATGSSWQPSRTPGFAAAREAMIDRLADSLEDNCDVSGLLELAR